VEVLSDVVGLPHDTRRHLLRGVGHRAAGTCDSWSSAPWPDERIQPTVLLRFTRLYRDGRASAVVPSSEPTRLSHRTVAEGMEAGYRRPRTEAARASSRPCAHRSIGQGRPSVTYCWRGAGECRRSARPAARLAHFDRAARLLIRTAPTFDESGAAELHAHACGSDDRSALTARRNLVPRPKSSRERRNSRARRRRPGRSSRFSGTSAVISFEVSSPSRRVQAEAGRSRRAPRQSASGRGGGSRRLSARMCRGQLTAARAHSPRHARIGRPQTATPPRMVSAPVVGVERTPVVLAWMAGARWSAAIADAMLADGSACPRAPVRRPRRRENIESLGSSREHPRLRGPWIRRWSAGSFSSATRPHLSQPRRRVSAERIDVLSPSERAARRREPPRALSTPRSWNCSTHEPTAIVARVGPRDLSEECVGCGLPISGLNVRRPRDGLCSSTSSKARPKNALSRCGRPSPCAGARVCPARSFSVSTSRRKR